MLHPQKMSNFGRAGQRWICSRRIRTYFPPFVLPSSSKTSWGNCSGLCVADDRSVCLPIKSFGSYENTGGQIKSSDVDIVLAIPHTVFGPGVSPSGDTDQHEANPAGNVEHWSLAFEQETLDSSGFTSEITETILNTTVLLPCSDTV